MSSIVKTNITPIILAGLLTVSVSLGQTAANTGLTGVVIVRPAHGGPSRIDEPDSAPMDNCVFTVQGGSGSPASFTTDAEGRFQISLSPGHYTVAMKERRARLCGPFEVDVAAGKMTTVAWRCDSGMR